MQRPRKLLMRIICSIFLLFLALCVPLTLDGQAFSNDLFGIALAAIAVALSTKSASAGQTPPRRRLTARIIMWCGGILIAVLTLMLPTAYREQAGFNRNVKALRERARKAAVKEANAPVRRGQE